MEKLANIITIADTKGGTTKSTVAVHIAAFCAQSGLKTLLIDFDLEQPTSCSYFPFENEAPCGVYEFIVLHESNLDKLISTTKISNLYVMSSNSVRQEIISNLKSSADSIIRLKSCLKLKQFEYDVIIIDTVGTIDPTVSMAVLAADIVLSPLDPSMPDVKEYLRGTVNNLFKSLIPFKDYGLRLPSIFTFFNRVEESNDCKRIMELFKHSITKLSDITSLYNLTILDKHIKKQNSYKVAASLGIPAFQSYSENDKTAVHPYKITKQQAQAVIEDIHYLCTNILPSFKANFDAFVLSKIA